MARFRSSLLVAIAITSIDPGTTRAQSDVLEVLNAQPVSCESESNTLTTGVDWIISGSGFGPSVDVAITFGHEGYRHSFQTIQSTPSGDFTVSVTPPPSMPEPDVFIFSAQGTGLRGEFRQLFGAYGVQDASTDTDSDGVADICDNCVELGNGDQDDADGDGIGDACDLCPDWATGPEGQNDKDGDGIGDPCECGDVTGEGIVNSIDARLIQRCSIGAIACSPQCDTSGDGVCNSLDARLAQRIGIGLADKAGLSCERRKPTLAAALAPDGTVDTSDVDMDGIPKHLEAAIGSDPTKPDTDSDGADDLFELYKLLDPGEADSDGDGLSDGTDRCPEDPGETACLCGDQGGPTGSGAGHQDGTVNLHDVFAINDAILNPGLQTPLCDTNEDDACDIKDVINANDILLGNCTGVCEKDPSYPGMQPAACP